MNKIEKAKQTLRENGYYVDNLWRVEDVMDNYKCTEEVAMSVLNRTFHNPATYEQIWLSMEYAAQDLNLDEI